MKKLITITLISLIYTLFIPSPVLAQSFDLSISPPLLTATVKPGKSFTKAFNIKNNSSSPVTLTARIIPFSPSDQMGHPQLLPQQNPHWLSYFQPINTDIKLNQPFTLKPQQKEQIVLAIKIPSTAAFQDLYATLLLQSSSPDLLQGSSLSGSIGSNLLISIANQPFPTTQVSIQTLEPTTPPLFKIPIKNLYIYDSTTPLQIKATASNLGRHKTVVSGRLQLLKQDTPRQVIPLLPVNLLAQSSRTLLASSSGQPHLTIKPQLTRIGNHRLHLLLQSHQQNLTTYITLFFLPFKAILAIVLLTTFSFVVIKKLQDNQPESKK